MASGSVVGRLSLNPLSDADEVSHWPALILLADQAYIAFTSNDTTASTNSRANHIVTVSFWIADPPAVSFFTFHCSKLPASDSKDDNSDPEYDNKLESPPSVVGAEGPFVLIRTLFASGDDEDEYFLYKGDPKSPTLESIPLPDDDRLQYVIDKFGIVPRGDSHYLLVALVHTANCKDYRLHIYSSEDRAWTTKEVLNPCPGVYGIVPQKVFMLQDSRLCWVDLLQGILLCDVLQEPVCARFIPLPAPLPENREKLNQSNPGAGVRAGRFQDVAYTDGVIKFVEMEHHVTLREIVDVPPERPFDPRREDVLYDSHLMLMKNKPVVSKPKVLRLMNGWSAITWIRHVGSDCWFRGCSFDVDDILVDEASLALLSGESIESSESFAFKNMCSAWPILSSNDTLYLKSYKQHRDSYVWVVAVDLAERRLKVEAPGTHPFGNSPSLQRIRPCTLSNHIKMTLGIKVSACQIEQRGESENKRQKKCIVSLMTTTSLPLLRSQRKRVEQWAAWVEQYIDLLPQLMAK